MKFDVTQYQFWIPILGGVIIPFVVAAATKINASAHLKALVAFVCIGITAMGTYLTDTGQSHTWKGVLTAAVLAMVAAGSSRIVLTQQLVDQVTASTPSIGLGRGPTMSMEATQPVFVPTPVPVAAPTDVPPAAPPAA